MTKVASSLAVTRLPALGSPAHGAASSQPHGCGRRAIPAELTAPIHRDELVREPFLRRVIQNTESEPQEETDPKFWHQIVQVQIPAFQGMSFNTSASISSSAKHGKDSTHPVSSWDD